MKPARRRATTRNFHLPLLEEIHEQIRHEAERVGRPATVLVREAPVAEDESNAYVMGRYGSRASSSPPGYAYEVALATP